MVDRVVKVSLRAEINNYLSNMKEASRATREVGSDAEKTAAKLQKQKEAFNLVGGALVAAGTLAAAAVGVAIKKWADFDEAMSAVAAATHETEQNMQALRDAALDAGARTVFSATEAANAIEELGKAGLSTSDILNGGLDGALDLAAAGGIGVADAAGIAAVALKTFNLEGSDMAHVADLLAAGAGKAMGDVQDLSAALSQGGQVAASTGLTIEETTAALSAFAAQGLIGSDAGTSFKAMLQRLTPQSAEAKRKMDELGISAYDASGNFVGLSEFAGTLQAGLKDLTTEQRQSALATIFGSDAVRAATVLYTEGADGIRDWEAAVDDAGYAAETAALRLDNLKGDWEAFGGAVDTAAIKAGEAADGPLRFLTQTATDMVSAWAAAPPVLQQGALAVGAVTAAVAIASGGFLLGVPKVAEYRAALATMGTTAQRVGRVLGAVTKAAGFTAGLLFAVNILDKLATSGNKAALGVQQVSRRLEAVDLDAPFRDGADSVATFEEALRLIENQDFDAVMENIGESIGGVFGVTGVVTDAREALTSVDAALAGMAQSGNAERAAELFDMYAKRAEAAGVPVERLKELFPEYAEALAGATPAAQDNTEALAELQGAAADATGSVGELADAIRGFGSAELDSREAARELEQSFADLQASIDANGTSLDITTEAGRSNEAALDGIARAALESAAATATQTGSQDAANAVIATGRERLIGMLAQFGITGQAAEDYVDDLGLIPENVATFVDLQSQEAMDKALAFAEELRKMPTSKTVYLYIQEQRSVLTQGQSGLTFADGGRVPRLAGGSPVWWWDGVVAGRGGPRDDLVPARLSPGEFVVNAAATARNLAVLQAINSGAVMPSFADAGPVYAQPSPSWGGGGTVVRREGDTITIHEASDPVATAQAVQRRQHFMEV